MKKRIVVFAILFSTPALALAAIDTPQKVINAITRLSGWMYGVLLAAAVLFILLAAFNFLSAGDDAEKITKARRELIYAAVAVGVAILATGIITLVQDLLGAS